MQSVGALVRGLREERGWSQRILAEKTGFSREYVAGVEWSGKGSVNFLKECERVFSLEQGSLLKWPAYSAALLWCRRNKLRIVDYIEMLRQAEAGFRPAPRGGPEPQPAEREPREEDTGALAEKGSRGVVGRRARRIMSTLGSRMRLELVAFFCDLRVVLLPT